MFVVPPVNLLSEICFCFCSRTFAAIAPLLENELFSDNGRSTFSAEGGGGVVLKRLSLSMLIPRSTGFNS